MVQSQTGKIVSETLSQKYPTQKRAGRVAQSVDPEFKSQNFEEPSTGGSLLKS
jgi:hypothetical protein